MKLEDTFLTPPAHRRLAHALVRILQPLSVLILFIGIFDLRPLMPTGAYALLVAVLMILAYKLLARNDHRVFILYVLGFALFNGLRTFADDTGHAISFGYAADIDRAAFTVIPSSWLQTHFYIPGGVSLLGWAAIITYTTYFTFHYLTALLIWLLRREELQGFTVAIVATIFLGLAVYYVLPTAPPWLAAEHGQISDVTRIAKVEQNQLWAEAYNQGSHVAGTNDVAAMPSLHTALTMTIALAAWRINRLLGGLGFLYVGAMGFSLVYLGEHYVVDVVAGVATAVVAWHLVAVARRVALRRALLTQHSSLSFSPAFMLRDDAQEVA